MLGTIDEVIPVERLSRDLREAARRLTDQEARYLVDAYYTMQKDRIRASAQVRSMENEPTLLLQWLGNQSDTLENEIKKALDRYSRSHPVGEWMRSQKGVGPVISAGFLAHLNITKAITYGDFHSFCGLMPESNWPKGERRPWNAEMKRLCFLLGESFVKSKGGQNPGYYGRIYDERKAYEIRNNEAGKLADQAAKKLERFKIGKSTEAYKYYAAGKLPPAHIHARARRYAAKAFLADLHVVWHWIHYGRLPAVPYPIAHQKHTHIRWPPGHDHVPGLTQALEGWGMPSPDWTRETERMIREAVERAKEEIRQEMSQS